MVLPPGLFKIAARWHFTCYLAARKIKTLGFHHKNNNTTTTSSRAHLTPSLHTDVSKCPLEGRENQTVVCDFDGTLLRTTSLFPFFMLVAFEGGGILRALMLLLLSPVIFLLGSNREVTLRLIIFISFFGLRKKDVNLVARSVLPKFYLENLHRQAHEVFASCGRKVVLTRMPRVMVERFLKEYCGVETVYGVELEMMNGGDYFTGFISCSGHVAKQRALKDMFGEVKADLGLLCSSNSRDTLLIPYCKETYVVSKSTGSNSNKLPREKYPKPLIFHDGRLAFLPTPLSSLSLFLFLPMGIVLALLRLIIGLILPFKMSFVTAALCGVHLRVNGLRNLSNGKAEKSVLYVCTHRTLIDPILLSTAVQKPVPAVTYSLSLFSEFLAPMKTVRLTRDREHDAAMMKALLSEGDLAVCPEGTTCREPYLLRFSPLFAEMTDEIMPVAVDVKVGMFYGTTASGLKWLDPLLLVMNPTPCYRVELLGRLEKGLTCAGGWSAAEVANRVQRQLGDVLGFECTGLTRKDKYMMLAENDGVVSVNHQNIGIKHGCKN
ncbi:hypothetical protein LUZ63_013866 [Rhynchospora breviuscula]|uniref:Phospholipid/glycerol acyltransferase domain-containing protein n=1 Tax=Rhynchospora breviuscula TaxID=2022672 RepID=A0A9Q0HKL9_9POAL|nr:hypothetical protein LUZ63_013866 [Rhynchospora breviuscula]